MSLKTADIKQDSDLSELAEAFLAAPSEIVGMEGSASIGGRYPVPTGTVTRSYVPALKGIPKSGLTKVMRAWMSARAHSGPKTKQRFTVKQLCAELDVKAGSEHQKVRKALGDFEKRGEITSRFNRKHNRRQYYYNHNWHKAKKGTQNQKIFKAMYVSQSFAVTDIQRLAGENDRCWIDKIVRQLKKDGHLQKISKRLCAHGAGSEAVYHILNRDKFKLENMK